MRKLRKIRLHQEGTHQLTVGFFVWLLSNAAAYYFIYPIEGLRWLFILFAVFTTTKKENCTIFFFAGLVIAAYSSWIFGTFIGALASDFLPTIVSASLGIGLYAMFIGLLFPALPGNWRLGALVALTAICNTILSLVIPSSWALIASTLLCAFAGVFFVDLDDTKEETADGQQ